MGSSRAMAVSLVTLGFCVVASSSECGLAADPQSLRVPEVLTNSTNVWMGVSVEATEYVDRIDCLRQTDAHIKFLSLEPLLGPLPELNLVNIDWVIVGGESGPKARPMRTEWVIDIRDQCHLAGVPFFFKQWGGRNKKAAGRLLERRTYDEFPAPQLLTNSVTA